MSLVQRYAQTLSELSGKDFQGEVCARFQAVILSFQSIPSNPHGDAGLDGFSHDGEHGYCCYGPEHDAFKKPKDREKAIVKKFASDLRRLFELDFKSKKLIQITNAEMATILPTGRSLKHIKLLVNWFDSHRILNPISDAVAEYKAASACKYVDPSASVVVMGPKELASWYAVDEATILRATQVNLLKQVTAEAATVTIDNATDFDAKMDLLLQIKPSQAQAIAEMKKRFLEDWRMALAFARNIDGRLPTHHFALEQHRARILQKVAQLMIESEKCWAELGRANEIATVVLAPDFNSFGTSLLETISSGEIARLIGECPIGWELPGGNDA